MKHKLYKVKEPLGNSWEYVLADNQKDAIENYCDHYCSKKGADRTKFGVEYIDEIIT